MDRRAFIGSLPGGLLAAPLAANAQQSRKVYRIGYLSPAPAYNAMDQAFDRSMKGLGYIEGQNLALERRYVSGQLAQFSSAAAELVRLNVDLIVVWSHVGTLAAKNATSSIPIVFLAGGEAVDGLVASLPRPGANVTGVTFQARSTLTPKLLELLKDLIPRISRVAVLRFPPEEARKEAEWSEVAARTLGINVRAIMLQHPDDLREAFAVLEKEKPQAVIGAPSGLLYVLRREIVEFTAKNRLPGVYGLREVVMEGGLMSFSPDLSVIAARGSYYVDRILRGVRPADIPVEQPTKFELVINLKTAKALGLTIPPSLLQRADQVID